LNFAVLLTYFGRVSVEVLGLAAAPQVFFVPADPEEVFAAGAARHEALFVVVAARKVGPAKVVFVRVAAVAVAVESRLNPALDAVLVFACVG
jgi:hypothetical protein